MKKLVFMIAIMAIVASLPSCKYFNKSKVEVKAVVKKTGPCVKADNLKLVLDQQNKIVANIQDSLNKAVAKKAAIQKELDKAIKLCTEQMSPPDTTKPEVIKKDVPCQPQKVEEVKKSPDLKNLVKAEVKRQMSKMKPSTTPEPRKQNVAVPQAVVESSYKTSPTLIHASAQIASKPVVYCFNIHGMDPNSYYPALGIQSTGAPFKDVVPNDDGGWNFMTNPVNKIEKGYGATKSNETFLIADSIARFNPTVVMGGAGFKDGWVNWRIGVLKEVNGKKYWVFQF